MRLAGFGIGLMSRKDTGVGPAFLERRAEADVEAQNMHRTQSYPSAASGRYSAKKMHKPVNFFCHAPGAKSVSVVGDFNAWDPTVHVMRQSPDGAWVLQVPLHHGHHPYLFLVDGRPTLDPRAQGVAHHDRHEKVSLLSVS